MGGSLSCLRRPGSTRPLSIQPTYPIASPTARLRPRTRQRSVGQDAEGLTITAEAGRAQTAWPIRGPLVRTHRLVGIRALDGDRLAHQHHPDRPAPRFADVQPHAVRGIAVSLQMTLNCPFTGRRADDDVVQSSDATRAPLQGDERAVHRRRGAGRPREPARRPLPPGVPLQTCAIRRDVSGAGGLLRVLAQFQPSGRSK